ncbi:O-methyltransferase [Melanomma pulvis-pyrius CBS 109.77]|uniref:O-methyltransferase n=1 Tax=Melanomma pulvis-pyrius CBS 109.77 TaxID=1314802 RepID=A0A6A6X975_9PLEO|nr:O-methyltransferase [Melanomma pulvis-pyrius CBS 109.77]
MSDIGELAARIEANTRIFQDYLKKHDLPMPSHEVKFDQKPSTEQLPDDVAVAQTTAIEDSYELRNLLMGPAGSMLDASSELKALSLQFILRFKIHKLVKPGETMTFEEIALKCNLDALDTRRLLRMGMAEHIFQEPQPGVVAHTAASQALADDVLLASWLDMVVQELWPCYSKLVDSITKYPGSEEANQTAYSLVHNTTLTAFQLWEQDPVRAARMGDGMSYWKKSPGFEPEILTTAYDFSNITTFIDVGGSHGFISIALARQHPHLKITVQDLPATIKSAKAQGFPPEDVRDRVSFMAHDFWSTQPIEGADMYYFRLVFHDWSDEYCCRILRQLAPALIPGSRILINDACVPPWGLSSPYQARRLQAVDLTVKCFSNARERAEEDWRALFRKADTRFKFLAVTMPTKSALALIEAEWSP